MADRRHEASRAGLAAQGTILPPIYWKAMLRGKEWMVKPEGRRLS
jgi:sulfide:quinone oxidoreductase